MAVEFSADEVYRLAEQIEKQAVRFYREVARRCDDAYCRSLFESLADMEDEHGEVFATMRGCLASGDGAARFDARDGRHWQTISRFMLVDLEEDLRKRFAGKQNRDEILQEAMNFERDTILFLTAMRDMVSRPEDRTRVDHIIQEETGHLMSLGSRLAGHKPPSLSH